jgi:uncharacterized protein with ATP-grasp and redox domains
LRRVLIAADRATSDEWLHRKILGEVMLDLARVDEMSTPAEVMHAATRRTARTLGVADPFAEEKRRWIEETTSNADWIRSVVRNAPDPFGEALRLSLAAGIFDCEFRGDIVRNFSLKSLVDGYREVPFSPDSVEEFRQATRAAEKILFVHATAAELLFDKLLIETMGKPPESVVSVVREAPVLAHATREDALAVGLDRVAAIVDPGIDCLGLPLNACSESFRAVYRAADLVVAKGQACYETLEGKDSRPAGKQEVFFLLRVKCAVMARHLGVAVGDCVLEAG